MQADAHELAIRNFKLALAEDPEFEEPLYEAVYAFQEMGDFEGALKFCKQQLDIHPYSVVGWFSLASLYQYKGLFEQAIQAVDFAIAIDEGFISAYYVKGICLMELGRYEAAVKVFLELLNQDPADAATLMSLAECYEELDNPGRARFYYTKVTNYVDDFPEAYIGIAATLETESRFLEAAEQYRRATTLHTGSFDAWLGLAHCEYELGNRVLAWEALEKAIELDPGETSLWLDWAQKLLEDGQHSQALDLMERGLQMNPRSVDLAYHYAAYAFEAGRAKSGFVALENALLLDYKRHQILYKISPKLVEVGPIRDLIAQYQPRG
jgi:tetratricopeptide (TPR) repeat protein